MTVHRSARTHGPNSGQWLELWVFGRLAEAVEASVFQTRNAWCELEAEQNAKREDMVGIITAVGIVTAARDFTLMAE